MHVIVIGSGIAALACIRQLPKDVHVTCITQTQHTQNNSYTAQGGICFSKYEGDNGHAHCEDTFLAGHRYGDRIVIQSFITKSHAIIQDLIDEGLPFDRDAFGELTYGMEGAHSQARILHAGGDETGRQIMTHLASHLDLEHLTLYENGTVVDILKNEAGEACGVHVLDAKGERHDIEADAVVCATGGVSHLFTPNSNPNASLSTGAILAFHHDIPLHNMELIQFHPTLLGTPKQAYGLISEAVRGAGAILVNDANEPFMNHVHPMQSLAPRDITSRAIVEQQTKGHQCYLDIRPITNFKKQFPTITRALNAYDSKLLTTQRIPVTPGAHYTIGGISAQLNGQTTLPRFFAIGEAACTHFHGANRLASNSLLEGLVMGTACAEFIDSTLTPVAQPTHHDSLKIPDISSDIVNALQAQSFSVLGVMRNGTSMRTFLDRLDTTLDDAPLTETITKARWERYCTVKLMQIITQAALTRSISCGVHYRTDATSHHDNHFNEITEVINGGKRHVKSTTRQREVATILH
ncbi:L-aspartate oxidase [Staphylococcus canis]|uniref:L-aspartate oxidase n=1 Tax=Staphylococcus canis TaxID=2724942 RepID=A0ABS0T8E4_9STAP|nr:FAD-binding protein [Staphylococcus canis]MBI5974988.1 FAD-binding protein [Staphylococcus canis]